jgi:hypothetical protein
MQKFANSFMAESNNAGNKMLNIIPIFKKHGKSS